MPLFLASVSKKKHQIEVYNTLQRFFVALDPPQTLELVPNPTESVGKVEPDEWKSGGRHSLKAPILRVEIADLAKLELRKNFEAVLTAWIEADALNCTFQRIGIERLRRAPSYRTNELPDGGFEEVGQLGFRTKEAKSNTLTWAVEVLDNLGAQFKHINDHDSECLVGVLLHRILTAEALLFADHFRYRPESGRSGADKDALVSPEEVIEAVKRALGKTTK